MNKILVVEDEKLIRQGISAMIKRSGVPYEEVIECSNGLQALEILKTTRIDVMLTDIRMPKMNGIELVQSVQELDNPPLSVAVSGYDDFSYAVEMMRQGVREYILKPVERDKLKEVLTKLDEELNNRRLDEEKTELTDTKLLKYFLQDSGTTSDDIKLIAKKIKDEVGQQYNVYVAPIGSLPEEKCGILLKNVLGSNVMIVSSERTIHNIRYVGVSDSYSDASDLKKAYTQARDRRMEAFLQNMSVVDEDLPEIPEMLLQSAQKYTDKKSISARVQLMGTDRTKDLKKEWDGFFIAAIRGQIPASDFLDSIEFFITEFTGTFREEVPVELKNVMEIDCLDIYREKFMSFILERQSEFMLKNDSDNTSSKMQEAIKYIKENYSTDLNMAVVSNHISMNYSLFSTEFKNFTGTNFVTYVKDLRMAEAKELLANTDLKVNEISAKVGYDNEKHFMKSFKSYVGVSPTEYRKNASALR